MRVTRSFHTILHPASRIRLAAFLLAAGLSWFALAQDQPTITTPLPTVTREDIERRTKEAEGSTTLDGSTKASILESYAQALAEVQSSEDWNKRAKDSVDLRANAPELIRDLEEQAGLEPPTPPTLPNPTTTDLDTLTTLLSTAEAELVNSENSLHGIQQELAARSARRSQIDALITAARAKMDTARTTPAPAGAGPEQIESLRVFVLAWMQALNAEITAHTEELASFDVRGRLLTLQEELAQRDVDVARRYVEPLRQMVAAERLNDANRSLADAEQAHMDAEDAPELIRGSVESITEFNLDIAKRRANDNGPQAQLPKINAEVVRMEGELRRLSDERAKIEAREASIGRTEAVGTLLRTYRENLPESRTLSADLRLRKKAIDAALLEQIELSEARADVSATSVGRRLEDMLGVLATNPDVTPALLSEYRSTLSGHLGTQRTLLDALIDEHDDYLNALLRLNKAEEDLLVTRNDFANYINERVLWIASANVISLDDLTESTKAVRWVVDWHQWVEVGHTLLSDVADRPAPYAMVAVFILAAVVLYPRIRKRLTVLAEQSQRRAATNYWWTVETLAYTLLLSAVFPLAMFFVAWRLSTSLAGGEFARVVGSSLFVVAAMYSSVEFPRRTFAPRGLGEIHFDWPPEATTAARRALSWAMAIGFPLLFFIALMETQESGEWRESAGRIVFVLLMLLWAWLGHQLTNKRAPSIMIYLPLSIPGQRERVRRILYLISAGAPISFAIAALAGYFDTALRLALRIHITLILIFLVSCGAGLAMRALLLTRRKLAFEQARKKRAELREAQKKAGDGADATSGADFQEPEIDLAQIDVQTTRLTRSISILVLSVGLWMIWVDLVPALRVLNEITIGETTAPIRAVAQPIGISDKDEHEAAAANGEAAAATAAPTTAAATPAAVTDAKPELPSGTDLVGAVEALTYADVLVAVIVIWLTISATRNLPGLLEIAVLQRIKLAPGERYAIKTVLGYVIAVIGTIAVLNILGIRWERMQWLVAALGLGIGFGLQEIVANFISGLIILFERPVRLGDTVTVGDVSGTVSRIQIRATTITDGERKDLIVPNKEFVTGRVLNWTLTDNVLRTTIAVGVDCKSDPHKVQELLLKAAQENSRVLKEPAPGVVFTSFGEGRYNFDLSVYVSGADQISPCRDELHLGIDERLKQSGIELAYPHTDIRIRNTPTPPAQGETTKP